MQGVPGNRLQVVVCRSNWQLRARNLFAGMSMQESLLEVAQDLWMASAPVYAR